MAVKAEVSFKVFENGKRSYSVHKVTMVDSWEDVINKAKAFVREEYPEIDQSTVVLNEVDENVGLGIIIATYQGRVFKLEANVI